jgi:hypothetical protein
MLDTAPPAPAEPADASDTVGQAVGAPAAVDEAPRDIDGQLRMDYRREDDCSLAIVQEDGGVIAAGGARLTLDSD